ncbi:SCP-like protein [Ancylostoma caninum]|uniref:SCP-like protein n=1 Tax=Ancylostoma caninum TaxID=29170 RepID=A0A368GRZ9_ANCCA|nr:SCP-like protein [Ancylostoma caninum]
MLYLTLKDEVSNEVVRSTYEDAPITDKMVALAWTRVARLWDCNIEAHAWKHTCDGAVDTTNYYGVTDTFKNKKPCNDTVETEALLKQWWSESTSIDLDAGQTYDATAQANAPKFSHMAAATAQAFACSYSACTGSPLKLLCVYKKLNLNDPIYEEAADKQNICANCPQTAQGKVCDWYLCQTDYTSPADIPALNCADEMTGDLQTIATDMHNYYRRLVATGWGKDKVGYAPRANAMLGLKYVCGDPNVQGNIGKATKDLIDTCPKDAPQATAAYSLNHFYKETYKLSREELLQEAIKHWANEASVVGVGEKNLYKPDAGFNDYANMMQDTVSELTCAVKVCQNSGKSAVACQYNKPTVGDGDEIYQLGKPCSKCPTGKSCDNALGGGLCVT